MNDRTSQELGERLINEAIAGDLPALRETVAAGGDINFANAKGVTPLMVAAQWGRSHVVRFLLENGADVSAKEKSSGRSALMYSCLSGDILSLEAILEASSDVNARDHDGRTALMLAAINGVTAAIRPLVMAGSDIRARDQFGLTAVHLAYRRGRQEVLEVLASTDAILAGTATE
jgi:ankyrin repeat protein